MLTITASVGSAVKAAKLISERDHLARFEKLLHNRRGSSDDCNQLDVAHRRDHSTGSRSLWSIETESGWFDQDMFAVPELEKGAKLQDRRISAK